jgi:hypothetical protein
MEQPEQLVLEPGNRVLHFGETLRAPQLELHGLARFRHEPPGHVKRNLVQCEHTRVLIFELACLLKREPDLGQARAPENSGKVLQFPVIGRRAATQCARNPVQPAAPAASPCAVPQPQAV